MTFTLNLKIKETITERWNALTTSGILRSSHLWRIWIYKSSVIVCFLHSWISAIQVGPALRDSTGHNFQGKYPKLLNFGLILCVWLKTGFLSSSRSSSFGGEEGGTFLCVTLGEPAPLSTVRPTQPARLAHSELIHLPQQTEICNKVRLEEKTFCITNNNPSIK